jgi:DNA modification methylase
MRQIVRAALPLGTGTVLDPFMGGGSTVAAAVAVGYESIGLEQDPLFFQMAADGIPELSAFKGSARDNSHRVTPLDRTKQPRLAMLGES